MDKILKKLYQAGLKFLVPLNKQKTFELIVKEGKKLVKADYGSIFLEINGELKRAYSSSLKLYEIQPRKKGFTYRVFKSGKPLILTSKSLHRIHPQLREIGIHADIIIPLINSGQTIGLLAFMSKKQDAFRKEDIYILQLFSQTASSAIRKAELYEESQAALLARDFFISMAAHELRTPITTISGYAQLLYSKFAEADTVESKWVADLSWETMRLGHLVNELLEVEKIKSGQFQYNFRECSIKEVVRRAVGDFKMTHPNHDILVDDTAEEGKDITIGDFEKLLQMVINLLDNGAKFSPSGSLITIRLRNKSRHMCIAIQDRGKGIPKKDLSSIFEKYYKADNSTKEGMGIGLFLVRNIVKQHHGEIVLKSRENKGTTVEVRLPKGRL